MNGTSIDALRNRPGRFILGAGVFCFWVSLRVSGQTANDQFEDRIILQLSEVKVEMESKGAGFESLEPSEMIEHGEGSIWWEWKAPISDRFTLSTDGSDFDSILGVYRGSEWGALDLVVFNDDEDLIGGVFTSETTFFAMAGETYQIAVAALKGSAAPDTSLQVHLSLRPSAGERLESWRIGELGGDFEFNSDQLSGDLWIMDFWATWCVPCRAEIPIFNELQERFGDRGLRMLGVSVDSVGDAEVLDFVDQFPIEFPVAMTRPELEDVFGGIASIPTAFVLDADNRLITKHVGFRDRAFWMEEVESLLVPAGFRQSSPQLGIHVLPGGDQVELSWPLEAGAWSLESTADLTSTWSGLDVTTEVDGSFNKVRLPRLSGQNRFFRLIQP